VGSDSETALPKKLQNAIGDLITFPFLSDTNFNYGPHQGTQELLNIQSVVPFHVTSDWNVITRTILPLIWQPSLKPAQTVPFGTGPITFSAFLSPRNATNAGYGAPARCFRYQQLVAPPWDRTSGVAARLPWW